MIPKEKIQHRRQRINVYHNYFRRSGMYRFIGINLIKLVISLIVIGGIFIIVEKYLIDFNAIFDYLFTHVNRPLIFIVFFISEIFLGLLPPDLFIAWTHSCFAPWLGVTILALSSYTASYFTYKIGYNIRKIPKVNRLIERKYQKYFIQVKKFGGLVIVFAALFPLPYSPIVLIAGILHYPFKNFMLLAIFRIIRFFIFAAFIYWGLNSNI